MDSVTYPKNQKLLDALRSQYPNEFDAFGRESFEKGPTAEGLSSALYNSTMSEPSKIIERLTNFTGKELPMDPAKRVDQYKSAQEGLDTRSAQEAVVGTALSRDLGNLKGKDFADAISKLYGGSGVNVNQNYKGEKSALGENVEASYTPSTNTINIKNPEAYGSILHETMHSRHNPKDTQPAYQKMVETFNPMTNPIDTPSDAAYEVEKGHFGSQAPSTMSQLEFTRLLQLLKDNGYNF